MTIKQFIKKLGSLEAAAAEIGISYKTLYRWKNNKSTPRGLEKRRLEELGIEL